MNRIILGACVVAAVLVSNVSLAGPVDPDCNAEKAAKGAATKATVGVGGRCSAGEAAADTAKRKAGVEEKGPIEKKTKGKDDAGVVKNTAKKVAD
jgi:hypothetical protein